jgi:ATP-dependent HslUV protease ATP-binding subunit HslU
LPKDASFEEVQNARNFLYEQYRWHEPSRESIELAFEAILKVRAGASQCEKGIACMEVIYLHVPG